MYKVETCLGNHFVFADNRDMSIALCVKKEDAEKICTALNNQTSQGERSHTAALFNAVEDFRDWTYSDEGVKFIKDIPDRIWKPLVDALKNSALQESGNSAMQQGTSHIADFPDVPTQYKQLTDDMTVTLAHYGDMVWGLVSELGCDNFECVGKRAKVIVVSATSA